MFIISFLCALIYAFALVNPISVQAETVYVFANIDVFDNSLTQNEVQKIYLGKKDKWGNNRNFLWAHCK